jgi:hypothetical protein
MIGGAIRDIRGMVAGEVGGSAFEESEGRAGQRGNQDWEEGQPAGHCSVREQRPQGRRWIETVP